MLAQGAPAFPVAGKTAFLRFMLYGTRFPFTGVTTANHSVFAWIGSSKALANPDRGATNEGYMFADYNGVSIEPMWSGYFRDTTRHLKDAAQANKWHCWEVEIDNAGGPPPGAPGVALPHIWEDSVELKLNRAGSGDTYAAITFEAILFLAVVTASRQRRRRLLGRRRGVLSGAHQLPGGEVADGQLLPKNITDITLSFEAS